MMVSQVVRLHGLNANQEFYLLATAAVLEWQTHC